MDGPGPIRPGFPPRFDGPPGPGPEFFNRMPFDDHPRHRGRYDERRRFPRDDNVPPGENSGPTPEKPERERDRDRKSRWSSGSPIRTGESGEHDNKKDGENTEESHESHDNIEMKIEHKQDNNEPLPPGSTTPVRDEFENCKPPQIIMESEPEIAKVEMREEPQHMAESRHVPESVQDEAPVICNEPVAQPTEGEPVGETE